MHALTSMYHPITGKPFQRDESYREVAPCAALAPYIRCFWGSGKPLPVQPATEEGIVIPDTCMDIIFRIDYANNHLNSVFCGLDEHAYRTPVSMATGGLTSTFAIRFYAWTACLFAEEPLLGSANERFPLAAFFQRLEAALAPLLFDEPSLEGKVRMAERVLLALVCVDRADAAVLNAVHRLLATCGRTRVCELSASLALSPRQLERRFNAMMGVSPKTFASLTRYQMLWQDMVLSPRFDPLDAVDKFGYTDQAHLLHDFRSRHLLSPREALCLARR